MPVGVGAASPSSCRQSGPPQQRAPCRFVLLLPQLEPEPHAAVRLLLTVRVASSLWSVAMVVLCVSLRVAGNRRSEICSRCCIAITTATPLPVSHGECMTAAAEESSGLAVCAVVCRTLLLCFQSLRKKPKDIPLDMLLTRCTSRSGARQSLRGRLQPRAQASPIPTQPERAASDKKGSLKKTPFKAMCVRSASIGASRRSPVDSHAYTRRFHQLTYVLAFLPRQSV